MWNLKPSWKLISCRKRLWKGNKFLWREGKIVGGKPRKEREKGKRKKSLKTYPQRIENKVQESFIIILQTPSSLSRKEATVCGRWMQKGSSDSTLFPKWVTVWQRWAVHTSTLRRTRNSWARRTIMWHSAISTSPQRRCPCTMGRRHLPTTSLKWSALRFSSRFSQWWLSPEIWW